MVWKPYRCARCGQHKVGRSQEEAGSFMRRGCASEEPRHEPRPVRDDVEDQLLLEAYDGVVA